jgi:hypothetical protein
MASLYNLLEKRLQESLAESKDRCAFGIGDANETLRWHQGRASALVDALHMLAEANKDAER